MSTMKRTELRLKELSLMFSIYIRECSSHQPLQLLQLPLRFGTSSTNPFHAVE